MTRNTTELTLKKKAVVARMNAAHLVEKLTLRYSELETKLNAAKQALEQAEAECKRLGV